MQIKSAIEIFKAAHPGCQALFIFNQSSTHASLPLDALQAFDMNKSNGGKQTVRYSHATINPRSSLPWTAKEHGDTIWQSNKTETW
jgi:hypothetical protein